MIRRLRDEDDWIFIMRWLESILNLTKKLLFVNSFNSSANIAPALIWFILILLHFWNFVEVVPTLSTPSQPEVKVMRASASVYWLSLSPYELIWLSASDTKPFQIILWILYIVYYHFETFPVLTEELGILHPFCNILFLHSCSNGNVWDILIVCPCVSANIKQIIHSTLFVFCVCLIKRARTFLERS